MKMETCIKKVKGCKAKINAEETKIQHPIQRILSGNVAHA